MMKLDRLLGQLVVHGVGAVQADRQRRGGRHDHDRRGGPDGGLGRADPPVPAVAAIPAVLKMPEVPQVSKMPEVPGFSRVSGRRGCGGCLRRGGRRRQVDVFHGEALDRGRRARRPQQRQ